MTALQSTLEAVLFLICRLPECRQILPVLIQCLSRMRHRSQHQTLWSSCRGLSQT